jgi:tRNA uridine 5-carboxymethylaminomethyl modification enzyme
MFTSRAEHRILLRQDNADLRLTKKGYDLGLAGPDRMTAVEKKMAETKEVLDYLAQKPVEPAEINSTLLALGSAPISEKAKAANLLRRPNIEIDTLTEAMPALKLYLGKYNRHSLEQAVIALKYESYIQKEHQLAAKMEELEDYVIKERLDYNKMPALSKEAREKLLKVNPETIGQASRISGITPADISVLMVYLGK